MTNEKRKLNFNVVLYLTRYSLLGSMASILPTVVIHNYLMSLGAGYESLGFLSTLTNVAGAVGLFAFAGVADRFRRFSTYKIVLALAVLGYTVNALTLIASQGAPYAVVFRAFAVSSILQAVTVNLCGLFETTSILRVTFDRVPVSRLLSVSGIIAGAAGLLFGVFANRIISAFPLARALNILCVSCVSAAALASVLSLFFSNIGGAEPEADARASLPRAAFLQVLCMREFRLLLAPNVLRAVQVSGVYFINAIALSRYEGSAVIVAGIAVSLPAAMITGGLLMTAIHNRLRAGRLYQLGCTISCAGVVALPFAPGEAFFLAAYFVTFVGQTLIDYGFPMGIYDMVPAEQVGQFSAVRMLIYSGATALFTLLLGYLLGGAGAYAVLFVTAAALLSGGALFCRAHARVAKC